MSYTATKYVTVKEFPFPQGQDKTERMFVIRGNLLENDTSTEYSIGGIGSTSFEVTAFSNVGLVTYSNLVGIPLINGQKVVVYNTSSNTNDGTYTVSAITPSSATAGTFVAVPLPLKTLAGSSQTSQTAEGVGQVQWCSKAQLAQTFTVSGVSASGGITTVTYTTLVGPQIYAGPGQTVTLPLTPSGTQVYGVNAILQTSSTGGSFTVNDPTAVVTTGSGTGVIFPGTSAVSLLQPVQVNVFCASGYIYRWNRTNGTVQIFVTGASSGAVLSEAALGATVAFDNTITFEATFNSNVSP